mmetsp:Transcript_50349/g.109337  ORF Transcript_50349/g.109337 Transcript_50349/m.109337 type:complete len:222 (+) Transcript_50349:42-707(+)
MTQSFPLRPLSAMRSRAMILPIAVLACLGLLGRVFVGAPRPQLRLSAPEKLAEAPTTMFVGKKKVKERQSQRSKERAAKYAEEEDDVEITELEWPVKIPEGETFIHVEYGTDAGEFPKPGNYEVVKLYEAMFSRFQHRVRILHNYPPALKEFSPTESWRNNSFEVIDLGSKELLFSKLDSSRSLVTGNDDFFENWMDKFAEKRGLGPLQPSSQVEATEGSN